MYQNYVFDLYGTLVDVRTAEESWDVYKKLAKFFTFRGAAYQPEELRRAFHALIEEQVRERTGSIYAATGETIAYPDIDVIPVYRALAEAKGLTFTEQEARLTANWHRIIATRRLKVYPGVLEVFQQLKDNHKGIYLLSNAQREYTYGELVTTGLLPWFDGVLISSDYGCRKPDPVFFGELTRQFGIDLRTAVMVGNDSASDIAGANAVGMDSVLFVTNRELAAPVPGVGSTYTVDDGDFRKLSRIFGLV